MNQANLKNIEQDLMSFSNSSLAEQWDPEMDQLFEGLNLEIPSQQKQSLVAKKQNKSNGLQSWMNKLSQKIQNIKLHSTKIQTAHA
ncbi:MAG: hypothetical protein KDK66_04790 [Deltaproteobacteria bacterium]|nr:hypothetical protein [Deltaproteobacteria bacterium]